MKKVYRIRNRKSGKFYNKGGSPVNGEGYVFNSTLVTNRLKSWHRLDDIEVVPYILTESTFDKSDQRIEQLYKTRLLQSIK